MPILLSNFVWEGTSLDMDSANAKDGHIFKQLDTGESYIMRKGKWHFINLGLSFIKATKSGRVVTDANGNYHVTFTTPFINDQYSVALSCQDSGTSPAIASKLNKTINGFDIYTINSRSGAVVANQVVSWLATRDYNP